MDSTHPEQSQSINVGDYLVINGNPCKCVERTNSGTGKHGKMKFHYVGIDIFTSNKHIAMQTSGHNMDVPVVKKEEYVLNFINNENPPFLSLMDGNGSVREDIRLPAGELGEKIKTSYGKNKEVVCVVLSAMGKEKVVDFKELAK